MEEKITMICRVDHILNGTCECTGVSEEGTVLPFRAPLRILAEAGVTITGRFMWYVPTDGRIKARDIDPVVHDPQLTEEQSQELDRLYNNLRDLSTEDFIKLLED